MMSRFLLLYMCICYILSFKVNNLFADEICKIYNIKTLKQLKEKRKICKKNNKILISYDQTLEPEILIGMLCDLKYNVIHNNNKNIINTRDKSKKILCIYNPSN